MSSHPPVRYFAVAARHILGGWWVSGITTLQTGQPFHVTVGVDRSTRRPIAADFFGNQHKRQADSIRSEVVLDLQDWVISVLGSYSMVV